ncbi:helix-turn-helix transcriptional regulator [Propionibacterium australiense]|uniref:HTH ArsR-type DNA-binding domain n=1 Tax=Propionibacterium australiense TaxID=119981 RepID=A0A383S5N8_9ACTN|nr:helix-turn-helix domain-containing protein [Propionibacterium australiense]SYZ33305.1 HTH ArsR-type DNA-binding domain [Propionibacterium australiense]VEH89201.1 Predicted transcriptional regulator [Propionibacterium australiense]
MSDEPRAGRAAGPERDLGAVRERVLSALVRAGGPLSIDDIAASLDVHPNTVRFHLNRLAGEGIVEAARASSAGRGRPRMLYTATDRAFSAGPQNDRLLADVFMHHFARLHTGALAAAAEQAGREWAGRALDEQPGAPGGDDVARLVELFDTWGFSPVLGDGPDGERTVELCTCPFSHEVEQLPELVCPAHRGIAAGVLERLGDTWRVAELTPRSSPGRCTLTCCRAGR